MAGFRGVLARGDIGAAQETEFARCDIRIAEGLCTPPECRGEQHRCAKPGSHSHQNRKTFGPDLFRLRRQRRLMPALERQTRQLGLVDGEDPFLEANGGRYQSLWTANSWRIRSVWTPRRG